MRKNNEKKKKNVYLAASLLGEKFEKIESSNLSMYE